MRKLTDFFRSRKQSAPPLPTDLRCSFCNKSQRYVKKLVAGPNVCICDECVDICLDILNAPQEGVPEPMITPFEPAGACSLCRLPAAEGLVVRERGLLCPGCVGEIEAALAKRDHD